MVGIAILEERRWQCDQGSRRRQRRGAYSLTSQGFRPLGVTFSPDSRRLASFDITWTRASNVKLWDLAVGKELLTFSTKALELTSPRGRASVPTSSLSFSPDGNRLSYVVGSDGRGARVQFWDATPLPDERPEASPRLP
jgi:WD40 repeat protein